MYLKKKRKMNSALKNNAKVLALQSIAVENKIKSKLRPVCFIENSFL